MQKRTSHRNKGNFSVYRRKRKQLEEASVTEEQFLSLLIAHSPLKEAERQFSLELSMIKKIVDEAQAEIDRVVKARCERMSWFDVTDKLKLSNKYTSKNGVQRIFLFIC